jgi:hypothetical protein
LGRKSSFSSLLEIGKSLDQSNLSKSRSVVSQQVSKLML